MKKHNYSDNTTITEELKEKNNKLIFSKFEHDFYDETQNVPQKVIRVKRLTLSNKTDKWKIFEDNKVLFTIEGSKLTKKEKEFLYTVDGINFLINQFKTGIKSLNNLKTEIKKQLGG